MTDPFELFVASLFSLLARNSSQLEPKIFEFGFKLSVRYLKREVIKQSVFSENMASELVRSRAILRRTF